MSLEILIIDMTYLSLLDGGANRGDRLREAIRCWTQRGHKVSLLTTVLGGADLRAQFQSRGWDVTWQGVYVDDKTISSKAGVLLEFGKRAAALLRVELPPSIDMVYTLTGFILDVMAARVILLRRPNTRWVAHVDNLVWAPWQRPLWDKPVQFFYYSLAWLGFALSFRLLKKAEIFFTVTSSMVKALRGRGLPPERVKLSGNGVSFDDIPFESAHEIQYDCLYIGRVEIPKGSLDLIEVWRQVCEKKPEARLGVVGGVVDELRRRMVDLIEGYGLASNIDLLGYRGGAEKYSFFLQSKVFVYPSYDESYGQALMEALACGLPAVAYDLPVYREIYPEGLVKLVPKGDVKGMAEAVISLLEDEKEREELGRRGRAAVENLSWSSVTSKEIVKIEEMVNCR